MTRLVDVRHYPGSRAYPDVGRDALTPGGCPQAPSTTDGRNGLAAAAAYLPNPQTSGGG